MSGPLSITELQRMTLPELRRDLRLKHAETARMRMSIEMQSEKNHALYRSMKREIARMTMVLRQMEKNVSSVAAKEPTKKETTAKASQTKQKSVQGSRSTSKK